MTDTNTPEMTGVELGNAFNVAAVLAAGAQDPLAYFDEIVDTVIVRCAEARGLYLIKAAFPDAQVVEAQSSPHPSFQPQQPQQQYAPPPPPQGQYVQGPAPVPGTTSAGGDKNEEAWKRYFANPDAFYNNIGNKNSENSPDFKEKKGEKVGLWIYGKYPNPDWVMETLKQRGVIR